MVAVTLTLVDEVVDGRNAVRLLVGHDISPEQADATVTPAMQAAVFLIETYKSHGTEVGEKQTSLAGMEAASGPSNDPS